MHVKFLLILISMVVLMVASSLVVSLATENQGAENIELAGGKRGKVPFPHRQHQKNLADCQICHSVFPQEPGAVQRLKAQGALKKKYVMNKLCTKCHKAKKKAGQPSGPTTCTKCHVKEKD
ncbi:hypothetical protein D1BOALGB6SA_4092 [Olavius sp. associated proteobacterium Delta 1]|nr:hypothetical protein D1BOALGB6SA_4092 [Olavius sp. associated proteobacterium Delta 1]